MTSSALSGFQLAWRVRLVRLRRAGGGSPAVLPPSGRPRRRSPGWCRARTRGTPASPRTARTLAWRSRSPAARCPSCRPGRTARGRCRGSGRGLASCRRRQRGRGWSQGSTRLIELLWWRGMAAGTGGAARDAIVADGWRGVARTLRAALRIGKKIRSNPTLHLFFRCP